MRRTILLTLILACLFVQSKAQLKPARIFGDHMVLQRNQPIPVWGTTEKNAKVDVHFNGQHMNVRSDAQGNWKDISKPDEGRWPL
jgi:sialate O-acetylesterase